MQLEPKDLLLLSLGLQLFLLGLGIVIFWIFLSIKRKITFFYFRCPICGMIWLKEDHQNSFLKEKPNCPRCQQTVFPRVNFR